ncbi:MAG: hypothetical protein KKC85_03395, partial [Gammaproteobacteria bacterium]|nr:hypothetical protein [Gammaproteobacteria bacterium]
MSDAAKPFAFSQFVPGFDFLKNLAAGAAGSSGGASVVPGMPGLSNWVAPTLSVEEVEKRIQELKTVQYWLEQNGHALKATIQALEVQKMTLSTLRGMNVQMEDIANAFTRHASTASPASAPASASSAAFPSAEGLAAERETSAPATRPSAAASDSEETTEEPNAAPASGVIDALQWWGALSQQFQQIASSAMQEASQLKMPVMAQQADAASAGAPPSEA